MYHYTACGLTNIWLANGYTVKSTAYGEAVSIADARGLHKAIGLHFINLPDKLTGAQIRFFRTELDLSQKDLATILGVTEDSVRGWENHRSRITKPVERLLRLLYREHIAGDSQIKGYIDMLSHINRSEHSDKINLSFINNQWLEAS